MKPHLLIQLEAQLAKIGIDDDARVSSDLRLRVVRDAFETFVAEFGVYRSVLNRIRCEYDANLEAYAQQARFVSPLKTRLLTMKQDFDAKIASMALACAREKVGIARMMKFN